MMFRLGRRRSLIAYFGTAGIALLLSLVIPEQAGEQTKDLLLKSVQ